MRLNEPRDFKSGAIMYADSSYVVRLESELGGEAWFGMIGYSTKVFKNVEMRLGSGFGQAKMDFHQNLKGVNYYSSEKDMPPLSFNSNGKFFSIVGLAEVNYFYYQYFSLGLSGDYVWMKSPVLPAAPAYNIPERKAPLTTFSFGLSLGFHF